MEFVIIAIALFAIWIPFVVIARRHRKAEALQAWRERDALMAIQAQQRVAIIRDQMLYPIK